MLAIYCDESGKHEQAENFVIAGLRTDANTWSRFFKRWEKALADEGLPAFHMADCENGHGAFKGMSVEKREGLQRRFIDIITRFHFLIVSMSIPRRLFPSAVKIAPGTTYKKHPYFFVFQTFVQLVVKQPNGIKKRDKIHFFFDRQDEFGGFAKTVLWNALKDSDERHERRLGGITFVSKDDPDSGCGVQAADIVAYEIYRTAIEEGRLRWQTRMLFREIYGTPRCVLREWGDIDIRRLHQYAMMEP